MRRQCLEGTLQWHHSGHDGISNQWLRDCLLNHLIRRTSKLHVTGHCEGNPPVTGGFPTKRASKVENVSIWWWHHEELPTLHSGSRTCFSVCIKTIFAVTRISHCQDKNSKWEIHRDFPLWKSSYKTVLSSWWEFLYCKNYILRLNCS